PGQCPARPDTDSVADRGLRLPAWRRVLRTPPRTSTARTVLLRASKGSGLEKHSAHKGSRTVLLESRPLFRAAYQFGDYFLDHVSRDGERLQGVRASDVDADHLAGSIDHRSATLIVRQAAVVGEDTGKAIPAHIPARQLPDGRDRGGTVNEGK